MEELDLNDRIIRQVLDYLFAFAKNPLSQNAYILKNGTIHIFGGSVGFNIFSAGKDGFTGLYKTESIGVNNINFFAKITLEDARQLGGSYSLQFSRLVDDLYHVLDRTEHSLARDIDALCKK